MTVQSFYIVHLFYCWFSPDLMAAMLVYFNKRILFIFFLFGTPTWPLCLLSFVSLGIVLGEFKNTTGTERVNLSLGNFHFLYDIRREEVLKRLRVRFPLLTQTFSEHSTWGTLSFHLYNQVASFHMVGGGFRAFCSCRGRRPSFACF